jgi:hypothetical protein
MKWNKFQLIVRQYPWILDMVTGWLDLGSLKDQPVDNPRRVALVERKLKEEVRKGIEYIAFRPFDKLDLSLEPTPYDPNNREWTMFDVDYHVGYEENPGSRWRSVSDGKSIKQFVEELRASEGAEAYANDKVFVIDRILRIDVHLVDAFEGTGPISVQIYPCPAGCGLHLVPPLKASPPVDPSYLAYINHEPMPPIVPSMISSAG